MRITEPMTMLTDYVLGALAFVLAMRLLAERRRAAAHRRLWASAS